MKILVIGYGELAEEFAKVRSDFDFVGIKGQVVHNWQT